jgi:toluene monooxygenase electron transfer component
MPEIAIEGSGTTYSCAADDTILRAALRRGLGFPYECNVGSCGNCRFELIAGEVAHRRAEAPAWSDRDRKRNRWLGCQSVPAGECTIKVWLDDRYVSKHRPKRTRARLIETFDVVHDIREFRFALAEPSPFLPGQYALTYLPGVTGSRAYSMCNVSPDGAEWHFQVKRVPNGAGSRALFDGTAIGDEIPVDGPYGMAYLREDAPRDILCLAGGSGLPPMLSIARAFSKSEALAGRQLHFVYGGRAARDICGEPMLRELPGFGTRIHYYPAASRPESDPQRPWEGRRGLIHEVTREIFDGRLPEFEIYFAGPPAMAKAVQLMLNEANVPREQVHFDEFF